MAITNRKYALRRLTTFDSGITTIEFAETSGTSITFSALTVDNDLDVSGDVKLGNGGNIIADVFSGDSQDAVYYGDGSQLKNISGGSSRTKSSLQTTNSTTQTIDTIDTLTDDATNLIEVYVKAYVSGGAEYGIWKRTLTVTKSSGVASLKSENSDVDENSNNLKANSLTFNVTSGNVEINVTGIDSTTINWESAYEIIL